MSQSMKAVWLISMLLMDIWAKPYKFKSENGQNFLVINDDYLISRKEQKQERKKKLLKQAHRRKEEAKHKRQLKQLRKIKRRESKSFF